MRKSPDWFVRITLGALGLFAAAVLIGSAISGASAAEKAGPATDLCYPFKIGLTKLGEMTKASGGKLIAIPPDALPSFLAPLGKYGAGITGEGAFMAVGPTFSALFVLHGKQLCLARAGAEVNIQTPSPAAQREKPHSDSEGGI